MSVGYYYQDEWEDWDELPSIAVVDQPLAYKKGSGRSIDGITAAAVMLVLFLGIRLIGDRITSASTDGLVGTTSESRQDNQEAVPASPEIEQSGTELRPAPVPSTLDPTSIVYPYVNYALTQGVHGASYGHMAIDIAAGKGEPVLSPINGEITGLYIDEWGNTTLLIENEVYQVMLLHGNYSVSVGQKVRQGESVGTEGNNGYTLDSYGNSCRGRDCGYHTHINIYDKRTGTNVNPLTVLTPVNSK